MSETPAHAVKHCRVDRVDYTAPQSEKLNIAPLLGLGGFGRGLYYITPSRRRLVTEHACVSAFVGKLRLRIHGWPYLTFNIT